jgi:hypothetical protein
VHLIVWFGILVLGTEENAINIVIGYPQKDRQQESQADISDNGLYFF